VGRTDQTTLASAPFGAYSGEVIQHPNILRIERIVMEAFNDDHFWSAVKRRNVQEILEVVFNAVGLDEAADIAGQTTRLTDASMTRMRNAIVSNDTVEEEIPTSEITEDVLTVADIKQLIDDGDLKEAKKSLKKQFAKDHPQYKELKKLIKKARK